jgi:magnesium-transporting ATPase (P-type)
MTSKKWTNKGTIVWLKTSRNSLYGFYGVSVVSAGLLPLVSFLLPNMMVRLTTVRCDPEEAEYVSCSDGSAGTTTVLPIFRMTVLGTEIISFVDGVTRIMCSPANQYNCIELASSPTDFIDHLHIPVSSELMSAYSSRQQKLRAVYGPNKLELPDVGVLEILVRTIFSPFYLFQYFSVTVWLVEDYILFSILILLVTMGGIYITTAETHHNLKRLRMLAGEGADIRLFAANAESGLDDIGSPDRSRSSNRLTMTVRKDSVLVPGDIFVVEPHMHLPCDAILISGRIVVDESMLTGESIPVSKQAVKPEEVAGNYSHLKLGGNPFNIVQNFNDLQTECPVDFAITFPAAVLYAGTKVQSTFADEQLLPSRHADSFDNDDDSYGDNAAVRTRISSTTKAGEGSCYAVAYRTGFNSAKGRLIASLLDPKDDFVSFFRDSVYVILYMFLLATALYTVAAVRLYLLDVKDFFTLFFLYLDAITIAVPPSLVACLTIATSIAMSRLNDDDIYVSDTNRISWAGLINAVAFDKTGTLTEEKVQFEKVMFTDFSSFEHASSAGTGATGSGASVGKGSDHISGYLTYSAVYQQQRQAAKVPKGSQHRIKSLIPEHRIQFLSSGSDTDWDLNAPVECIELMATCHSLSLLPYDNYDDVVSADPKKGLRDHYSYTDVECDEKAAELRQYYLNRQHVAGDLLEVELFLATKWTLSLQGTNYVCSPPPVQLCSTERGRYGGMQRTILRHFPFSPSLMRSASLTLRGELSDIQHLQVNSSAQRQAHLLQQPSTPTLIYYVKGSVEMVASICSQHSVPLSLTHTLTALAKQGLRVLGMAYRHCTEPLEQLKSWKQSEFEDKGDLIFLGLCVLSSALKPTSTGVVTSLRDAGITVQMITGDHIFTAVSVARDCSIVDDDGVVGDDDVDRMSSHDEDDDCNMNVVNNSPGKEEHLAYSSFSSLTSNSQSAGGDVDFGTAGSPRKSLDSGAGHGGSGPVSSSKRINSCPRLVIIDGSDGPEEDEDDLERRGDSRKNINSWLTISDSVTGQVMNAGFEDILDAAALTCYQRNKASRDDAFFADHTEGNVIVGDDKEFRSGLISSGSLDFEQGVRADDEEKPLLLGSRRRGASYHSNGTHVDRLASPDLSNSLSGDNTTSRRSSLGPIEIAVTGKALHLIMKNADSATLQAIVRYAKVFARMKPADKKSIVLALQGQPIKDSRVPRLLGTSRNSANAGSHLSLLHYFEGGNATDNDRENVYHVLFCGGK